MNSDKPNDNPGKKGISKKKPPQVRQTLTSKYRMLKANPLLAFELERTLSLNSTTRENGLYPPLRTLAGALDTTMQAPYKSFGKIEQTPKTRVIQRIKKIEPKSQVKSQTNTRKVNIPKVKKTSNSISASTIKGTKVENPKLFRNIEQTPKTKVVQSVKKIEPKSLKSQTKAREVNISKVKKPSNLTSSTIKGANVKNINSVSTTLMNKGNKKSNVGQADFKELKSPSTLSSSENITVASTPPRGISPINLNNQDSMIEHPTPAVITPIVNVFKTPCKQQYSVLQDVTSARRNATNFSRYSISTPTIENKLLTNNESHEISKRLKEWLLKRGKSFGEYNHLKCFGVHTPKTPKNIQLQDLPNENIIESVPENNQQVKIVEEVDLSSTAKDALQDLHKLILEGYSAEQCEMWLKLIKQKCYEVVHEPQYWECRAALEQTKENIQLAVECYQKAIIKGAETQNVEKCLDQLLLKFDVLNINNERTPSVQNKAKGKIIQDVRNIFKSTIIQFAVREKNSKKKIEEGSIMEKQYLATAVRRSTRLSRSAFTSTPGVKIYSTLQDVDKSVKENLSFQCNNALND